MALFRDSLASRLTAAIMAALVSGAFLNFTISHVIILWSQPSLAQSGLLETTAEIVRILEAAPPRERQAIASEASGGGLSVDWYPNRPLPQTVVARLRSLHGDDLHPLSGTPLNLSGHQTLIIGPRDPAEFDKGLRARRGSSSQAHVLLVALQDGSWAAFFLDHRVWGVGSKLRALLAALLLGLSSVVIAILSARLLARPLEAFNREVQRLGVDRRATPVTERGPLELRRTISAVNAMQARIQAFVEGRTLLLATISHDLRTPLTRLRLRAELMRDDVVADRLLKDIDEMSEMVNSAIGLFRDDCDDEESATLVDLGALVQVVIDEYTDQGVRIPLRYDRVTLIRGRPYALKRAVRNLVDNAVRHACDVGVEVGSNDRFAHVAVVDRGPGLPREALERVFQPFVQLPTDSAAPQPGLGLGLASARSIALSHNGKIAAANRRGGGLRVSLFLPPIVPEAPG